MNELEDYLEEMAAFRKTCFLKFKNELGVEIAANLKITDFYNEGYDTYIIVEPGVRINIKTVLDADNKFGNTLS